MQVHPSTSQVAKARNYYLDAEKATSFEKKRVLYLAAAKEYLEAATTITNDELKRSLGYLSISCAQKASSYSLVEEIVAPAKESYDPAAVLHTERLLFLAHLENKRRIELLPTRCAETAGQVIRDILSLETVLSNIGFKHSVKNYDKNRGQPQQAAVNMMQSTFKFTSQLGESFMVLDPKGGARTNLLHNQSAQQMMPPPRRDNRENLRNHHDPQLKHTQPKHQQHQPQQHKQQHQQQHQHQHQQGIRNAPNANKVGNVSGDGSSIKNTISTDIENELNNPMVQSYLSTQGNSGRGDMQQSQFDFNNVTQSTLHTFDGIQNPEGVLNLLQTVRRIGDENAQLLQKLESLEHLEQRSFEFQRDVEEFKQTFEEKFDTLKSLLTEYAENLTTALASAGTADTAGASASVGSSGDAVLMSGSVVSVNSTAAPNTSSDLICSIINKQLRTAQAVKTPAKECVLDTSRLASSTISNMSVALLSSSVTRPSQINSSQSSVGVGIAAGGEREHGGGSSKDEARIEKYKSRINQLERMIKNLLDRVETAKSERDKALDSVTRYVQIINEMQAAGKVRGTSDFSNVSVNASTAGHSLKSLPTTEGRAGSSRVGGGQRPPMRDHRSSSDQSSVGSSAGSGAGSGSGSGANMSVAISAGGVVSTFRRPPGSSSSAPMNPATVSTVSTVAAGAAGAVAAGGNNAALTGLPMPPPPPAAQRSSSGSYRAPAQQVRPVASATKTLEFQIGAKLSSQQAHGHQRK